MERARSASIFCWPRTRFLRRDERFVPEVVLVVCAAFVAMCVLAEGLCLRLGFLVDLVVEVSEPAFAGRTTLHAPAIARMTIHTIRDLKKILIAIKTSAAGVLPPLRAYIYLLLSHGLRRGLHSFGASRLTSAPPPNLSIHGQKSKRPTSAGIVIILD